MTIRKLTLPVLLLVLIAPGLSSGGGDSSDSALNDGPAIAVRAITVGATAEPSRLDLSGELVAKNRIQVASKVAGRIVSFPVTEGSRVRRGQLLVQVDSPELASALAQSRAAEQAAQLAMETAVRQAERFRRLAQDEVVTARDLEMVELGEAGARASYESARAMREMSERNLGYAELRASQDGVVVRRLARAGDLATPGRPLLVLENPEDLEVRVTLPASLDFPVDPGARAEVTPASGEGKTFPATVDRVTPGADRHTIEAFLRVSDLDALSGTFVRASLFGPEEISTLRVPAEALIHRGSLTGVFVIQDGHAALRWLRLTSDGRVQAGLIANEQVILDPPADLDDGDPVEVTR